MNVYSDRYTARPESVLDSTQSSPSREIVTMNDENSTPPRQHNNSVSRSTRILQYHNSQHHSVPPPSSLQGGNAAGMYCQQGGSGRQAVYHQNTLQQTGTQNRGPAHVVSSNLPVANSSSNGGAIPRRNIRKGSSTDE